MEDIYGQRVITALALVEGVGNVPPVFLVRLYGDSR
jgi:hypothetical protein